MLDLLRVSSPFPRLTGALDVSPPRIGRKVILAKASFGSPQTGEPVFTRVPYSLAFSSILVCPSVLSFLQTCLFFSRLCVCVSEGWSRKCAKHVSYCAERAESVRHWSGPAGTAASALWSSITHRAVKMKRACVCVCVCVWIPSVNNAPCSSHAMQTTIRTV